MQPAGNGRLLSLDELSTHIMITTDIIVIGPAGSLSDEIVIAACRAGGRGHLYLTLEDDLTQFAERCESAAGRSQRPIGVYWGEDHPTPDAERLERLPACVGSLIMSTRAFLAASDVVLRMRQRGMQVYIECRSADQFSLLQPNNIDGVILKGNEAGGMVSGTTAFVLTQQWACWSQRDPACQSLAFFVYGGMGPHSAAAAAAAGAQGVVLDSQLLLAREARLPEIPQSLIKAMDGSESVSVGARLGCEYRLLPKPGSPLAAELADLEDELSTGMLSSDEQRQQFRQAILSHARRLQPEWPVLMCGQDVALAAGLAEQYVTVAGIIQGIAASASRHVRQAAEQAALAEGGPLAQSHGTRYPVLQGPMTRVSDVATFADAVSAHGALPFLALALLREKQVDELLSECQQRLAGRPWGVGLLGFLPPEIRHEQVRAIKRSPPAFAIIAGGRPDQALELEQEGITTYLHVPSPGLLRMFLRQGARRFIFEGRECGGHVGPRSSFVLWEQQIEVVLQHLAANGGAPEFHVVFAGGIHDARSAAMVAAMAAPLVARGVKIGILMGTAYLFTREAVKTGAIVPRFQQEALGADNTVLFETGPGHAIRCIKSPYFEDFHAEKIRLKRAGKPHREIVIELERKNTGRLRMASKGVDRRAVTAGAHERLWKSPLKNNSSKACTWSVRLPRCMNTLSTCSNCIKRSATRPSAC